MSDKIKELEEALKTLVRYAENSCYYGREADHIGLEEIMRAEELLKNHLRATEGNLTAQPVVQDGSRSGSGE